MIKTNKPRVCGGEFELGAWRGCDVAPDCGSRLLKLIFTRNDEHTIAAATASELQGKVFQREEDPDSRAFAWRQQQPAVGKF